MLKKFIFGLLKKLKFLPPPLYVKIYYEYYTGKKLDLNNPIEFNEKIQWLKVYYRPPILHQLVDKYAVRDYVTEKVGDTYLNDLIAVYEKPGDVDFDALPNQFVIKAVHGYNFNLIVNDKTELNKIKAKYLMHKWVMKDQYTRGGLEWAYKGVQPRLIAEKYLTEIGKSDIDDYKFYCFDGQPEFVQVDLDRGTDHKRCYYNMEWVKQPFNNLHYKTVTEELECPKNFDAMISICKSLSCGFPFVRVDLYNLEGIILFGEMTFYPGDGRLEYEPDKYNAVLGSYLKIPKIPEGKIHITEWTCADEQGN